MLSGDAQMPQRDVTSLVSLNGFQLEGHSVPIMPLMKTVTSSSRLQVTDA